jgi:hypothetical protein
LSILRGANYSSTYEVSLVESLSMIKYQAAVVPLRPEEHAAFKTLAARNGVSLSALIRRALAVSYGPALIALGCEQASRTPSPLSDFSSLPSPSTNPKDNSHE